MLSLGCGVSQPSKVKDPAYKRLFLFPVTLFYVAVLVAAAWPSQLGLAQSRALAAVSLAANGVLAMLAVRPAVNVMTGTTGNDRTATVRTCFKLVGYTHKKEPVLLFDSGAQCRERSRSSVKDPYAFFHDDQLRRSIRHLYTPGADLDRNQPPLSALFSLADYHCNHRGKGVFRYIVITGWYQRLHLDTGEDIERVALEGVHQCASGRWDAVRRPQSPESWGGPTRRRER